VYLVTNPNIGVQVIVIDEVYEGQRIDNYLFTHLKGLPKSRVYRALRNGEFRINKKRVPASYRLQTGDLLRMPPLRVATPEEKGKPSAALGAEMERAVIYEDKHLLVINKPSGVAVHGGSGINFGVIEIFRHLRPKLKFLELVHRLDRDTTGCLMLAKKPSILKELHQMLVHRQIEKIYLALVQNPWQGKERVVKEALQKNIMQSGERIVVVNPEGKPSETIFRPLKIFRQASLVEAKPLTGRTHQIRVHAAYLDHAILGDEKYGRRKEQEIAGVKHLLLHAASLTFTIPSSGETIAVCACLDANFSKVLKLLDN